MLIQSLAAALIAIACAACSDQPEFDLVVSGGTVIDGSGTEARRADVGIKGDRIAAIGNLGDRTTATVIDATGKLVAPGFINLLSRSGVTLLADGLAESHLRQGITTDILGAQSPAFWTPTTADEATLRSRGVRFDWTGPKGYFDKLQARGTAVNVGTFVPLSSAGGATAIEDGLRDGAFGVIDDRGVPAADLNAIGTLTSRYDRVLIVPADNTIIASDDLIAPVASAAKRVVIVDAIAPDVVGRIIRLNQRGAQIYGAVIPTAPPDAATPMREALRYGGVMVAADSAAAFPLLLGQIARDSQVMNLREAIRRSTSLPASVLRLSDRGIVRERWFADLVIFDGATIADAATSDKPNQSPAGIDYVIVNGVVAVTPKGLTGARPGYAVSYAAR